MKSQAMQMMRVIRRGISSSRALRGEIRSSGVIFDPFIYRGQGGQNIPPMFTQEGLKTRWGIMKGHLKSGMCAGVIQKHVPEFHASKFPPVANKIFETFLEAHRKGDMHALAGVTTEDLYATLKAEVKKAKMAGKGRLTFRLLGFKDPTQVLQMREHLKKDISDTEGWGQVTCKLSSEREIVPVDARGKELRPEAGRTAKVTNTSIGTFEVFFGDSSGRWRLALLHEITAAPAGITKGLPKIPQAQ